MRRWSSHKTDSPGPDLNRRPQDTKPVLYSLALFRLSYPEDSVTVGVVYSPSPAAGCDLAIGGSWKRQKIEYTKRRLNLSKFDQAIDLHKMHEKMKQPQKVFSEAWIERASSRYKAMLYSLALFLLSYPKDSVSAGFVYSPSLAASCDLAIGGSWKSRKFKYTKETIELEQNWTKLLISTRLGMRR